MLTFDFTIDYLNRNINQNKKFTEVTFDLGKVKKGLSCEVGKCFPADNDGRNGAPSQSRGAPENKTALLPSC